MTYGSRGRQAVTNGESGTHWPLTWIRGVRGAVQSRTNPSSSGRRYASHEARRDPSGWSLSTRIFGYIRLYFSIKGREREQYADHLAQESRRWVRAGRR